MATNLALDDALIREAQRIGHHKTKKQAVNSALLEYVKSRKRLALLEMAGTVPYDPAYDYKAGRKKR